MLAFGSLCGIYEPGQFGPVLVFQVSCTCLWFLTGVIPDVAMSYPVPILLAGASGLWASALCRIVPWTIIPPAALRVHQVRAAPATVNGVSLKHSAALTNACLCVAGPVEGGRGAGQVLSQHGHQGLKLF